MKSQASYWGCIDHTERLGFAKMPTGYEIWQCDSGHFFWHKESTDEDSAIHWNKWQIYHWAIEHSKEE